MTDAPPPMPSTPPTLAAPLPAEPARDTPDAGSRRSRLIALLLSVPAILAVMVLQQCSVLEMNAPKPATTVVMPPDPGSPETMQAAALVRLAALLRELSSGSAVSSTQDMGSLAGQMEASATGDVQRFRALIVEAELAWPKTDAIRERLNTVTLKFDDSGIDREAVLRILDDKHADALSQAQRDALVARHGYFGRLALSLGKPDTDPARKPLVSGGGILFAVMVGVVGVLLVGFVLGVACFIMACVWLGGDKFRPAFTPPQAGGSVYLEMVAVFALGFLALKLGSGLIERLATQPDGSVAPWAGLALLLAQWSLVLTCLYPLLRGVSWREHRMRLGWHAGKGVLREVRAGLFAYFAMLPIYVFVLAITILVLFSWIAIQKSTGAGSGEPPSNPIAERLGSADPLTILVFFLLATIWAPLVEEAIFRGAFFRHLRSRVGVALAAITSAICFGVMHGYPALLLIPVISLGVGFALMREWRGSLIAPMTAHALHNGVMLTIALSLFSVLRAPA